MSLVLGPHMLVLRLKFKILEKFLIRGFFSLRSLECCSEGKDQNGSLSAVSNE
jgi:hypothetical protein